MGDHPVYGEVVKPYYPPGHIDVDPVGDEEWPFYWNAWVGNVHVNGGVGLDEGDCIRRAKDAIFFYRNYGIGTTYDR